MWNPERASAVVDLDRSVHTYPPPPSPVHSQMLCIELVTLISGGFSWFVLVFGEVRGQGFHARALTAGNRSTHQSSTLGGCRCRGFFQHIHVHWGVRNTPVLTSCCFFASISRDFYRFLFAFYSHFYSTIHERLGGFFVASLSFSSRNSIPSCQILGCVGQVCASTLMSQQCLIFSGTSSYI